MKLSGEYQRRFFKNLNEDGKTVRAMDILFPGIGEIVGGSQERYDVLVEISLRHRRRRIVVVLDTRAVSEVQCIRFRIEL
jgi:hypothetical protein